MYNIGCNLAISMNHGIVPRLRLKSERKSGNSASLTLCTQIGDKQSKNQ